MRRFGIIFLILLPGLTLAQSQSSYDIFPQFGNFQRKGWIINPSLTYTVRPLKKATERIFITGDSLYDLEYSANGKLGVGIEIGRFSVIDQSRFISYIDYSVGLKILNGEETFDATLVDSDRIDPYRLMGLGKFSQSLITANFNITNVRKVSKNLSLHNSLGINGDYRFAEYFEYSDQRLPLDLNMPSEFLAQAHFKIGVGYLLSKNMYIIPSVETPILTFYQYDDLKSTLEIFNSRYRPLVFRLTVMILDTKPDRKCPKKNKARKSSENLFGASNRKSAW